MMDQPMDNMGSKNEGNPLDSIVSRIDSYIKDPALVTPDTLTELKNEIVDLKDYFGGEQEAEPMMGNDNGLSGDMMKRKSMMME